jgi:hypothetical protein
MAKLTTKERNALPDSAFALPAQRKYPINDPSHQRNAKARASEMEHNGTISKATEMKIDRKADKRMGKSHSAGHHNIVNPHSHGKKMEHI